jgi:hypothetical protein
VKRLSALKTWAGTDGGIAFLRLFFERELVPMIVVVWR